MSSTTAAQPELEAARLILQRMGISPADLLEVRPARPPAPTFAQYVPVVAGAVSAGTRRAYGSYWNRVVQAWGDRCLDAVRPSQIEQLRGQVQANVVARRNARGGRSAAEHLVAALRCLYRHAVADGYLDAADNPALKVAKPRRLPSTRRAIGDTRLAEINQVAATTGDDPVLDSLLIRLHTETACRRGGALTLRPRDLDPEQCLIFLREKGGTARWQPISPTLLHHLLDHHAERGDGDRDGATVFGKAGVTDVKAGTRLLRHNAASRLLRAAVPLPTISAVLGHASPDSTDLYLSVDEDHLLDCVLDVPGGTRS